jgi:hypothetical protein
LSFEEKAEVDRDEVSIDLGLEKKIWKPNM